MSDVPPDLWLAGVDGCPAGWIVAFVRPQECGRRLRIVPRFADVLAAPEAAAIIAVDMPIGLPERTGLGGRAAENAVRPLLGARQSSVFSVPARAAVYAHDYADACARALQTSDPPRKVSKQLFNISPRIREIDMLLREHSAAAARVFEAHPEVAFWRLNGGRPLSEPKKVRSRPYEPGLALRRATADRGWAPRASRERTAAERCGTRRPARRDGLRVGRTEACIAVRQSPIPIRRRATHSDWRWQSGPERLRTRQSSRIANAACHYPANSSTATWHSEGRLREEQSAIANWAKGGQSPEVMVIGCCNSRVSPEVIFNARPGELFVIAKRREPGTALHA